MIKKSWLIVLVLVAGAALAFGADKAAGTEALGGRDIGLIINLVNPFTFAGAGDGVQTGLGMKVWLNERGALRGLLALDVQSIGATTDFNFGVSAAYEQHLTTGKVSPYVGGIAGTAVQLGAVQNLTFFLGGLLGAEVQVMERVALFAEYELLFRVENPNFFIDLGIGNNAQLGVIVYLQ